jgi:uncharacterized protein YcbK (DUF882 family)
MSNFKQLTMDDLLMLSLDKRADEFPPSTQMLCNGDKLLKQLNALQELLATQFIIHSGYRPDHYNTDAGGAKNSPHLTCEAADLHFPDFDLKHMQFKLQSNPQILETFGLYMEMPSYTPTWVHLQTRPTHSRIFIP